MWINQTMIAVSLKFEESNVIPGGWWQIKSALNQLRAILCFGVPVLCSCHNSQWPV